MPLGKTIVPGPLQSKSTTMDIWLRLLQTSNEEHYPRIAAFQMLRCIKLDRFRNAPLPEEHETSSGKARSMLSAGLFP